MRTPFLIAAHLTFSLLHQAQAAPPFPAWQHAGQLHIITTPDGAALPAAASVENFPLLVRLHRDFFDFAQAQPAGGDLRFSSSNGTPLAHQIEHWDANAGTASIWLRIPRIRGNTVDPLTIHWGNPDAASGSDGDTVFNGSNGFVSVWHLGDDVKDEVGTLPSDDTGTTKTAGMIGTARHFPGKKGVFCGDKIPGYPSGASSHSTSAWFRTQTPNSTIIGWGNEGGGRGSKVRMQLRSPPHIHIDSDFSDVAGNSNLPMNQWVHVTHTYGNGVGKIYINGQLDGTNNPTLDIKTPSRLWLGGWYHNYDFIGDIDEVRISKVARSAAWVHLGYENQKPFQTLVGPIVQSGNAFSVSHTDLTIPEGESATLTAAAAGAIKLYWTLDRDNRQTVVATDRLSYNFDAGRVAATQQATLQFKAVYPDRTESKNITLTVTEKIPEPEFTLHAPKTWDGRTPVEITTEVSRGNTGLHYQWNVTPIAVIKQTKPGKLILTRAQNSGPLTVTATVHNGGKPTTHSVTIAVKEPPQDPWVTRRPDADEQPEDGQFYARNANGHGTLFYTGTLAAPTTSLVLKLYSDTGLVSTSSTSPAADLTYSLSAQLKPGLTRYHTELISVTDGQETTLHTAKNLVCGDAYIITGQSNAVATDWGEGDPTYHSPWIRSFGSASGSPGEFRLWGEATHRNRDREKLQVGYWAMQLGRRLVENHNVPIFLINGAAGGTRIDQHQRNHADPEDRTTIYGRLLWRLRQAKLTHGIRGVLWHQGENDQGAAGPTGGYGWETYRHYFIDLAAAWKQDYPNIQHYYAFQIWPKACSMGHDGSDNRLREVQRNLPTAFSNLHIMSTLGIDPPGGCHYPAAGYSQFVHLIAPLIERDHYNVKPATSITPPNLQHAHLSTDRRNLVLGFDQPVIWDNRLASQFFLDGEIAELDSAAVTGNSLTLKLATPSSAKTLTYLDSKAWKPDNVLRGTNGIAALTFCEVPILSSPSLPSRAKGHR